MPVPSAITDLSTTAASNSPAGSEAPTTADDYFRAHASFIAQNYANKLDKAGTVTATANQPMGGFKHTGAGTATATGQYVLWGQSAANLTSLQVNTTTAGSGRVRIVDNTAVCVELASSSTDATDKTGRIGISRRTNSETPFAIIGGNSSATSSHVDIGGGSSNLAPATSIRFHTDALSGVAGTGTEAARIDSSQRFIVGTDTALATEIATNAVTPQLQLAGTTSATSSSLYSFFADNSSGPQLFLAKSRNATIGSHTVVQSDDLLGRVSAAGSDGTTFTEAARISFNVDGTPGANDMPGRIVFSTTADGAASPSEAMRITQAGYTLIGYTTSNGAYPLQVNGQIFATNATIATSDQRYKRDVEDITGALDVVNALRPVMFEWRSHPVHKFPNGKQIGFIAQEVRQAIDQKGYKQAIVHKNSTVLPDGTDEEFLGLAESALVAVLVGAVKELTARVAALEAA